MVDSNNNIQFGYSQSNEIPETDPDVETDEKEYFTPKEEMLLDRMLDQICRYQRIWIYTKYPNVLRFFLHHIIIWFTIIKIILTNL